MEKRKGVKRSVIDISSSSSEEESSEELIESDEDFDSASVEDISSSSDNTDKEEYDDGGDDDDDDDKNNESCCDRVLRLLQGVGELRKLKGELSKLRLTECKAYLRSNELRLSGTKEECIERIIEHWRLKDGNRQRLYPRSSFTINCTGDVCKGDVVLFTQKVYKNFDKMTRGGKLLGKRTIAGRIVKESYGAAKQQHTFTVEVLWSQGVKKLPPLFPLLVKGRNLYKMKTFRQRWKNEEERIEVLAEKHKRGEAARFIRATRKSKSITKPTKASSENKGNKRQKLDRHSRPSEMMQTNTVRKHNYSVDECGKAMVGSKRTKHHHHKPHPLGRLNVAESRASRAPMRHPNFVPAIRQASLQFNYPSVSNVHRFESDSYSQRLPSSHSSNWGSEPRPHLSSYSSYALPAREHQQYDRGNYPNSSCPRYVSQFSDLPRFSEMAPREHQQYDHGNYPNFSYPEYVSQSSNLPHFSDMLDTHRSSGSFHYERRWNL